jgi:hypothetical protein
MKCGLPTTNGTYCVSCNRGFRRAVRNKAYDDPAWRRRRRREGKAFRATGATRCPRCGRPITKRNPLSLNHIYPLGLGGSIDGPIERACRSCNSTQRWIDMPTRRRRR